MINVLGDTEFFSILFQQQFNPRILAVIVSPHKIKWKQKSCKLPVCSYRYRFTLDFR